MKKVLSLLLMSVFALTVGAYAKDVTKVKSKKDVLKDKEYKELKTAYFNAEGYGNTYNCKVEQQRFCKVKDYDTGIYVLCDRDVSRTQWESAKIFYKYGRCVKLN
ncbi:hypothetical protein IJ531_06030 [bacterium]|nr:hypothetical protein [bacterium]